MLEKLKWYLINIGVKKYAPVGVMAAMASLGTLAAAHAGVLEQWGVNYIPEWSAGWIAAHPISGPILLIELDTTSTAVIAAVIALVAVMSRAGEHHTFGAPMPEQGVNPQAVDTVKAS